MGIHRFFKPSNGVIEIVIVEGDIGSVEDFLKDEVTYTITGTGFDTSVDDPFGGTEEGFEDVFGDGPHKDRVLSGDGVVIDADKLFHSKLFGDFGKFFLGDHINFEPGDDFDAFGILENGKSSGDIPNDGFVEGGISEDFPPFIIGDGVDTRMGERLLINF